MNKSLVRDPRVIRISSALKADRLRTIGGLFSAWCLFDEQTEDGSLPGYTPEIMDELVGMSGLSRAMESVGWMTIGDEFIAAPRFDEHNGASAKRRAQDCVRKKSARQADKHPQPQRTDCGPEKRREEKNKENPLAPFENSPVKDPCTIEQAIAVGQNIGITKAGCEAWWHSRRRAGWTIASNGTVRRITNWQSDLIGSKAWAEDEAAKSKKADKTVWKPNL